MAIFGSSNKSKNEVKSDNISSATIITQGSKLSGDLESADTVHVDGEVNGNISVNNIVVVGKSGIVNGNIKAQKVICSGKIDGFVDCSDIEILQGAEVSYKIVSKIVIINSIFKGEIAAEKILVDTQGIVENKIQAKEIVIKGSFNGDLSCELLTTKVSGKIKGNMFVKNILNEGGLVEGAIGQYKNIFTPKVKEIENKTDDIEDVEIEEK